MRRANGDASRLGAGLGLALLATALLAGRLAEGDLIGDPVIYAAVAKSMLVRGEWATQYLAGQPFFDKPPLVAWLAALAFELFGVSTWSARLPGVALGIAACLVLWRLGAFLFDERVGLTAGAILALTPGFVRFGSTLLLDTALALGALAGLLATARACARGGSGLWWAGVWFGVAFLGKGALALGVTTLPWLPLAAVGAWRSWRSGERGDGLRLLTVWTLVAYGFLFAAAKHSPRYLMLLHPALALWAALALRPLLPAPRALGRWVAAAAGLAWAVMLLWPFPLHPGGTGAAVTALAPVLGPREAPLAGFRLKHEGTRARFTFYADREDVRTVDDPDALVRLGAGTPVVTARRDAPVLAADGRFEELRRSRDFVAFRVR